MMMTTTVELSRTFSRRNRPSEGDDWERYLDVAARGRLTWSDLHEQRIVVVVGEAGIGKTTEFKSETERLRRLGKAAFFIELNQLVDSESWTLALGQFVEAFNAWQQSTEDGYFFLDAVDEARLTSHAALKRALQVVNANLWKHFPKVRVAISSRLTDWSIQDVQLAVDELLVSPIELACRPRPELAAVPSGKSAPVRIQEQLEEEHTQPFVAALAPLSLSEAQKLADAWLIPDTQEFWVAVRDGEYEHLATRPLDLRWMVEVWKAKRSLGTYRELIEGSVANRLIDTNPSYQVSGAVLSPEQLREGAELLAAATELSGRAYICCELISTPPQDQVAPIEVLVKWKANDVARLLASALFDDATFGRVKFHHRTVRAYLAACWLDRQLLAGAPLRRVLSIFVTSPFDEQVLIPSRRWAFCWLAAINAKVREWLVRHFPEMLLFDGDPEAWDRLSADAAFAHYVQWLNDGHRPDWYNNAAEYKRVGRALSRGQVATHISDAELPMNVKLILLPIVAHARLLDCSSAVFNLYVDSPPGSREQLRALQTLKGIATAKQRDAIKTSLLASSYTSNELIAAALVVVGVTSLTTAELTQSFMTAASEDEYGQGPMARAITQDILPEAAPPTLNAILDAVLACLPVQGRLHEFNKFQGSKPPRAWLLDVLPTCLERLLSVLGPTTATYPAIFLRAAIYIELLRDGWYTDRDLQSIRDLVANHPYFRWKLASDFSKTSCISNLTTRMCWSSCLVTFDAEDLPELTSRANDASLPPTERLFWFDIAKEIAKGYLRKLARKQALAALIAGVDAQARTNCIAIERANLASGLIQQHGWKLERRKHEDEMRARLQGIVENVRSSIDHVRDASCTDTLCWLVQYSLEHSGRDDIMSVDYNTIARDLGSHIAEALAEGLKKIWQTIDPPDPAEYSNGTLPWDAILAVAGLHTTLSEGQEVTALTEGDAERAARLSVWELKRPPEWFYGLVASHRETVEKALRPWIVAEAHQNHRASHLQRTLDLALRSDSSVRAGLIEPLLPAVLKQQIPAAETFNELFSALREDGLLSSRTIEQMCKTQLTTSRQTDELLSDTSWLRIWLHENLHRAWNWFEKSLSSVESTAKAQVKQFVETLSDFKWLRTPLDDIAVDVLMKLHALVSKHRTEEDAASDRADTNTFAPSMTRLLETIPGVLVGIPGAAAHQALIRLAVTETDPITKVWLNGKVHEHASLQASQAGSFDLRGLHSIGSPLSYEAQSAEQLFEQVIARLEELRTGMEEGPFSDRGLLQNGMKERLLQLWLAARLRDTPNGRFSVHREEDVDADNETDIQVSARNWNVCIEIKPVDAKRGYSAVSLTSTIRDQLVGQYLKGFNSSHGILVLFRLDKKTWDIPGVGKRQTFSTLVRYLQDQADLIKASSSHVQKLVVFPFDCVLA
ncbi:hypothetical protein [Burkholderia lata]|uniref:Uncharacterized protein n=1 Tax=Burkholderia lata (strain ATCC 17760 / DSM 23089 / LMG 22485 / NCIMB 9086 / R18194 / 383) TaxID=482957 RepID=A0A6P2XMG6_BURL3|nr:hypothetical protein [Burkholderia lata]VWD09236.1 hypothetical protein BLA18109_05107 [Burkholderia lata]